ncbi:neuronal acetylcholine receptor subunit alpha-7-like [Ylistrum balloti]|uniref:neuronal acetylcholine receptor subunit alpha-7-like n=1 Tax=Ylistrum balloti TaxID=509963 RepID=UPI002905A092|nr:neuronal acetylcholine receptor subunit alpha-7-like [Ylistrum balloti]
MNDLMRLRETLFQNYTKDFRPVYNLSDPLHVTFGMFLVSVLDLDMVSGTITLNCGVPIQWTDYRLVWTPHNYNDITSFVFNSSNVWKPRIYIATSSEDLSDISFDSYDVRVYSNGTVTSTPGRHVKASCSFDMTKFPSDSQICVLQFLSLLHTGNEVALVKARPDIDMQFYKPNGEWDIEETSVKNDTDYGTSVLAFSIHLTRRSEYFILSMFLPVMFLRFMNPFVFLLPASSGERISYIVTMSLSLAVYMTIVGENLPTVSDPMPGICYFFLVVMLNSCFLILLTILTLRCNDVKDVQTFPGWLLWLVKRTANSTCRKRKVINIVPPTGKTLEDTGTTADKNRSEELITHIQKEDVTRFIDKSLFFISLFETVLTFIVFIFYWK